MLKTLNADQDFEDCKNGLIDGREPIAHVILRDKRDQPDVYVEAYQFGMRGVQTFFVCRQFSKNGNKVDHTGGFCRGLNGMIG